MKHFLKITIVSSLLFLGAGIAFATPAGISTLNSEHYAWNDVVGWIDFDSSVQVDDTNLTGAANSLQTGPIKLNCAYASGTAGAADCTTAGSWFVSNDGNGNLAGWAWSSNIGWISFNCSNRGTCGTVPYAVTIDSSGIFSGWAWNDVIGWISFNCSNTGTCGTSDYKVVTGWRSAPALPGGGPGGFDANTWLESSTFNTQVTGGAAFNTLTWHGTLNGGRVGIQIATSNSVSGPWTYIGPDGTAASVYETAGPDAQLPLNLAAALKRNHNNTQYMRYKIWLAWSGTQSPHVDDVVISYSP